MYFAIDYPQYVDKLILVESVGIKGYPMFKKDEQGQAILNELIKTKEEIAQDPVQVLPILNAYKEKNKDFIKLVWDSSIYIFNKPSQERYKEYLDEILTQRNLVDIDYSLINFNISHEHNGLVEGSGEVDKILAPTLVIQGKDDGTQEMGVRAGLDAIKNTGIHPKEIDLILCVGEEWKEYPLTTSGIYIQEKIGATNVIKWG